MQSLKPISGHRLEILDGWRGLSIMLVLAAHLLPLSPKEWQFNVSVGILGMVIFFILSGFLITSFLIKDQNVINFIIRRVFRIIPLAWLYLAVALTISGASVSAWFAHYLFYANLPPKELLLLTDHTWSLCVEVQFYLGILLIFLISKKNGLLALPLIALSITALRINNGIAASSITYYRIDEILAGCTLSLLYHGKFRYFSIEFLRKVPATPVAIFLMASCMPQFEWLNYFRPYLAAMLIGMTLVQPDSILNKLLNNKILFFIAAISYSLYVIHPLLAETWLGSGDTFEKYAKRPLLFLILFILAYLSTKYYESWFISFGKKLTEKTAVSL